MHCQPMRRNRRHGDMHTSMCTCTNRTADRRIIDAEARGILNPAHQHIAHSTFLTSLLILFLLTSAFFLTSSSTLYFEFEPVKSSIYPC